MTKNFDSINIDNTNFIFDTNFAGDPMRDKYHDSRRKCKILLPDKEFAQKLMDDNIRVYETKPREFDDPQTFQPEYFVAAQVKYRKIDGTPVKYPPKVYLVTNDVPVLLDEDTINCLDNVRVKNVNVVLNPFDNTMSDNRSLFVRVMYVEQDLTDDPYADLYANRQRSRQDEMFIDDD